MKNRKPGRPKKPQERDTRVVFWLSQAQAAPLLKIAERDGLPLAAWVRWAALKVARREQIAA
jgi:hypothetical protein